MDFLQNHWSEVKDLACFIVLALMVRYLLKYTD